MNSNLQYFVHDDGQFTFNDIYYLSITAVKRNCFLAFQHGVKKNIFVNI